MKICLLGAGNQGRVVAFDLSASGHLVTVLDNDLENLLRLKRRKNIKPLLFDVRDKRRLVKFLCDFEMVVGALPGNFGFYAMECAIAAGVDMVDMSYLPEDPFLLNEKAKKRRVRVVPDAGFAPGLSNILVGETNREWKRIDSLRILVGGLPQRPVAPFNYYLTWSVVDLLEEYTRPARMRKSFKIVTVPALSGVEKFNLPGIGKLEAFYTDGLRTILKTFPNIKDMEEKTIRYPGHAQLFKAIMEAGFLGEREIKLENQKIRPKDFTLLLLRDYLTKGDGRDMAILIVELKHQERMRRYLCVDYYDEERKMTAMARMTGYTCSIITQCLKNYPDFGIIPPEYLGQDERLSKFIKKELKKRGIYIKKEETGGE